jgi:AraC-like DNA-binding protein
VKLIDEMSKQDQPQNDVHISKACKILREHPDMKAADVAKKVGLSLRNLQKLFREQYGISMTEYRASHKQ